MLFKSCHWSKCVLMVILVAGLSIDSTHTHTHIRYVCIDRNKSIQIDAMRGAFLHTFDLNPCFFSSILLAFRTSIYLTLKAFLYSTTNLFAFISTRNAFEMQNCRQFVILHTSFLANSASSPPSLLQWKLRWKKMRHIYWPHIQKTKIQKCSYSKGKFLLILAKWQQN